MSYLRVEHLYYRYQDTKQSFSDWVLQDITFSVKKGEFVTVVGPSGSGKSTLLKNIAGILQPLKGRIILENQDITRDPLEQRNVGYVPQNQALFPHLTVKENIEFGLKARKWSKERREKRVKKLAELGGLTNLLSRRPSQLSGGQQQRVALLRALAPYPRILLMDEPLSNLDAQLRESLALYLKKIQRELSITTIMVTHDLEEAKILADKVIVIHEGKILQMGTPLDVVRRPKTLEVAKILDLKNVYEIKEMRLAPREGLIFLTLPFGNLQFKISSRQQLEKLKMKPPVAVHLNPSLMSLRRSQTFESEVIEEGNTFLGKVLATVLDHDGLNATVMVKIQSKPSDSLSLTSEKEKIEEQEVEMSGSDVIRVRLTLGKEELPMVDDEVLIKISFKTLSFYYR